MTANEKSRQAALLEKQMLRGIINDEEYTRLVDKLNAQESDGDSELRDDD